MSRKRKEERKMGKGKREKGHKQILKSIPFFKCIDYIIIAGGTDRSISQNYSLTTPAFNRFQDSRTD